MEARRLILAVAVSLLALMAWSAISTKVWGPPGGARRPKSSPPRVGTRPAPAAPAAAGGTPRMLTVQAAGEPNDRILIGDAKKDNGFTSLIRLSTRGAGIQQASLAQHAEKVNRPDEPYRLLTAVSCPDQVRYSLATESLTVRTGNGQKLQIDLEQVHWRYEASTFGDRHTVRFWVDILHEDEPLLRVEKRYTLVKDAQDLALQVRLANQTDEPITVALRQRGPMGVRQEAPRTDRYRKSFAGFDRPDDPQVQVAKVARSAVLKTPGLSSRMGATDEQIVWSAQVNKFFAAILFAPPETRRQISLVEATSYSQEKTLGEDLTTVWVTKRIPVAGSGEAALDFELYLGPKSDDVFSQEPYSSRFYVGTVEYSMCTMQWLADVMMALLKGLYKVFRNYGVAIIIMVILVRVLLHPITKSSQASMFRMQQNMARLQPKQQALKEKYKDNRAALNKATMDLYKEEGINPATQMLGCLPMGLQMPIWVALWTALNNTFALRHEPFVWFIRDLAGPDALVPLSTAVKLPLISAMTGPIHGINILPLLLGVSMLVQQKFSPQAASADPAQAKQQKIMFYFMAGFFSLLFYNAPSGLNLYILTSNVIGFLENQRIRKNLEAHPERPAPKKKAKPGWWAQWQKKLEKFAKEHEAQSARSAKKAKRK